MDVFLPLLQAGAWTWEPPIATKTRADKVARVGLIKDYLILRRVKDLHVAKEGVEPVSRFDIILF